MRSTSSIVTFCFGYVDLGHQISARPAPPPKRSSNHSVADAALAVRCRPDLQWTQYDHRHESAVVVKDPVANEYHRLRPDEAFVLHSLTDDVSLSELRRCYEQRFAPERVTEAELNALLLRLHRLGLTASTAPGQGGRLHRRLKIKQRKDLLQRLTNLLVIRFGGVDPRRLLDLVYPWVQPVFSLGGLLIAVGICGAALVQFATHHRRFWSELPAADQWLRADQLLLLMLVIGSTKVLHELGHAMVCRHFGRECHTIGPMLLVFTPALYCDTSDSWMLPQRWKRAMVGMAGVATEVLIAAAATLVWAGSGPGVVHALAMNVMLVCSVSTVVFNANPLLRYDGYYVLSDWWDIPNLSQVARDEAMLALKRWGLAIDEPAKHTRATSQRVCLVIYHLLATVYRWVLTLCILWFVWIGLRPIGLESIGKSVAVLIMCGLLIATVRPAVAILRDPLRRKGWRLAGIIRLAGCGLLMTGLCFVPWSGRLIVSGRLVPAEEERVYVQTPGHLDQFLARVGDPVRIGDVIAVLRNLPAEEELVVAEGKLAKQQQLVESLRSGRYGDPVLAAQLPAAESTLKTLTQRVESQRARVNGLTIVASQTGRLLGPPRRFLPPQADHLVLVQWTGDPTASENQGGFLETGTELFSIIPMQEGWVAEAIVDQSEIERVRMGASVALMLETQPATIAMGEVSRLSGQAWDSEQDPLRRDDPQRAQQQSTPSARFVVRIEIPEAPEGSISGRRVTARI
ncbi:MAG: HlyD family efflux transporter periplasmic adaptor subunit, partial [Planctomycetota bacterium]